MDWKKWLCEKLGCNTPPPPSPNQNLLMCYFGTQDGQMAATAAHVNAAHIGSWGDWNPGPGRELLISECVRFAKDAVNHGVDKLIFTLDFCILTPTNPRHRLPDDVAVNNLIVFCDRLRAEGLIDKVIGWYPMDEPNIPEVGLSAADCAWACARCRDVTCHYTVGGGGHAENAKPMITTYAQRNGHYDGIESFDWVGIDNYGNQIFENGMYAGLVAQLNSKQKTTVVPGGSNPWREDPMYYYAHVVTDPKCAMIMPFAWFPSDGPNQGIGFNGMQPQYDDVGDLVKGPPEA